MRSGPRRVVPILLAFVLATFAGGAVAIPAEPVALRYSMHFGGFHVVDLRFEQERNGVTYGAGLDIRTTGLADMVVRYKGRAAVEGRVGEHGLQPEQYGFRYSSRKSSRVVEVEYDPANGDATRVRSEKRGKTDAVEVPRDLWKKVSDPLSAFLMLREHIRGWREGASPGFTAEVFDGRRRYVFEAQIRSPAGSGRSRPRTIAVDARIKPLAGFDRDDMSERERREGYRLTARFTDDEVLLPVEIRTVNTSVAVVIRLAGCTGQACASAGVARALGAG